MVRINSEDEDYDSIGEDSNIIDPRLLRYADRQNAVCSYFVELVYVQE